MIRQAAIAFGLAAVALSACDYDWNSFDPRLAPVTVDPAGTGVGGAGGGVGGEGGSGGASARCGDGVIQAGEQCDDAGTLDGDGCNASCQVECGFLLDDSTGHCYTFLSGVPVTWDDALTQCRALAAGWDLVAVSSQAEHDWLIAQSTIEMYLVDDNNSAVFWTGGSDAVDEDVWVWSNGEPFFANWVAGEPSNDTGSGGGGGVDPGEDCAVYLRRNAVFGYDDRPCDRAYAAVCERPPAGSTP